MPLELSFVGELLGRLKEPAPLIQVILGPRQVGKTTGVEQVLSKLKGEKTHYISADEMLAPSREWLIENWQIAAQKGKGAVLVIDEVQKIPDWSAAIKLQWDKTKKGNIKCVLLGSASLAIQTGLSESLAGRFEILRVHHWNYLEFQKAFKCGFEDYMRFGGYPASHAFIGNYSRWSKYLRGSIVETVIEKDIQRLRQVANHALFRQTFEILASVGGQEISFRKILGQLQDKGNTSLVKRYLELFEGAFLFKGLEKYSGTVLRQKTSSPKILPLTHSFYALAHGENFLEDPIKRGRIFEILVGTDLNRLDGSLYYWREGDFEVDYVWKQGSQLYGIEVKSGRKKSPKGATLFLNRYPKAKLIVITRDNYASFARDPESYIKMRRSI